MDRRGTTKKELRSKKKTTVGGRAISSSRRRNAIASSNFAFSASSAWDPSVEELYETCSGANDDPWRQGEVLQGSRVQLQNGFECAKENPTSVPTAREECSFMRCRSARAGGELQRNHPSADTTFGPIHIRDPSWERGLTPRYSPAEPTV